MTNMKFPETAYYTGSKFDIFPKDHAILYMYFNYASWNSYDKGRNVLES